jgi:hypothetical protein
MVTRLASPRWSVCYLRRNIGADDRPASPMTGRGTSASAPSSIQERTAAQGQRAKKTHDPIHLEEPEQLHQAVGMAPGHAWKCHAVRRP